CASKAESLNARIRRRVPTAVIGWRSAPHDTGAVAAEVGPREGHCRRGARTDQSRTPTQRHSRTIPEHPLIALSASINLRPATLAVRTSASPSQRPRLGATYV